MRPEAEPSLRIGLRQLLPLLSLSNAIAARTMFLLGYESVAGVMPPLPLLLIDEACDPLIALVQQQRLHRFAAKRAIAERSHGSGQLYARIKMNGEDWAVLHDLGEYHAHLTRHGLCLA